MKFDIKAFALTSGIMWALTLFVIAWWIIIFDGGSSSTTVLGKMYPGYTFSPLGSVIGVGWGLVDGSIGGAVFAWLYNRISPKVTATH